MNANEMVEISVIVPAYNEAQRLPKTLPHLWRALHRRFSSFEIIVVDDGSRDTTAEIVSDFGNVHSEVRLLRSDRNRGKGNAVRMGILEAVGRHVLFSDADLSTPLKEVRKLQNALAEGYDVAIGSRASHEAKILKCQPFYRILMGKTFNRIVRIMAVPGIRDTQCGFKCFPRHIAREIFGCCRVDGFGFDVEVLYIARHKGLQIKEVGVLWRNSPMSKVNPILHPLHMLWDLFRIRLYGFWGCYGRPVLLRTRTEI